MEQAVGAAHGKIILMGEHSVVYGAPALALPFQPTTITVTLEPAGNHSYIISALYSGPVQEAPDILDSLVSLLNALRRDHGVEHYHFIITIDSTIPIERGMGSSAALSIAFVRAFYRYINRPLDDATMLRYADAAEVITHGNPSGLDTRVTGRNQPLYFKKNTVEEIFHFETPFWLVVCDSGVPGNTKAAVARVHDYYTSTLSIRRRVARAAIDTLATLADAMRDLLTKTTDFTHTIAEQLGHVLDQAEEQLQTLQVSAPELDAGVHFLRAHGALGAKLTGGGMGGCYFGLTADKDTAAELAAAIKGAGLAVNTWLMPFQSLEQNEVER